MRGLKDCRLYGIVDLAYVGAEDVSRVTEELIKGGIDILQLRGKQQTVEELTQLASEMHAITSPNGVPLVVNDHAVIAMRVRVEGVHVGQDDEQVATVRERVGRPILVGKSTHSLAQATAAMQEKPDYIGFGPLFATATKPDYRPIGLNDIGEAHRRLTIPIFCIGGIKLENVEQVVAAGARRVVIVSGLLQAKNIVEYARSVRRFLDEATESKIKNRKS